MKDIGASVALIAAIVGTLTRMLDNMCDASTLARQQRPVQKAIGPPVQELRGNGKEHSRQLASRRSQQTSVRNTGKPWTMLNVRIAHVVGVCIEEARAACLCGAVRYFYHFSIILNMGWEHFCICVSISLRMVAPISVFSYESISVCISASLQSV